MPGKNKNPLLGWHPPAEFSAWVRDEAERRSVTVSTVLNEAIEEKRAASRPNRPKGVLNVSAVITCDECGSIHWVIERDNGELSFVCVGRGNVLVDDEGLGKP
jgi:alkylhydroperoxidase family enzyme